MPVEDRFKSRYAAGETPWDIGKPDFNLIQTVTTTPISPCKALDIGCGTGDTAIWLSQQGFHVVGIDTSGHIDIQELASFVYLGSMFYVRKNAAETNTKPMSQTLRRRCSRTTRPHRKIKTP